MKELQKVYERLAKNPDDKLAGIKLFHSDVHYARVAILENTGVDMTLEEVEKLLEEFDWQDAGDDIEEDEDTD